MAQDFSLSMPTERAEKYLAKMAKVYDGTLPEPISNIDRYLKILAENDAGGGSGSGNTPKLLENADLNTVTETGFYYGIEGHGCTNTPANAHDTDFSMIVVNGGGIVYQIFTRSCDLDTHRLFCRSIDNTDAADPTVFTWVEFATTADCAVDSVLSETSTRPPQNAIVTKRLNEIESNSAKKTDLTAYLPLHGTADKAKDLASGAMRYGACVNGTASFNDGYRWFRIGSMIPTSNGYDTEAMCLQVYQGYNSYGILGVYTRTDKTGLKSDNMNIRWFVRSSNSLPSFKLVAIESSADLTYELWCAVPQRYQQTHCTVMADITLTGGMANRWVMYTLTASDAQTAPSNGTKSVTDEDLSHAVKANEAETLTDSGWNSDIELFSEVAASTLKCRSYGKLVEIRGSFTLNEPSQHTPFAKIPLKFRPPEEVYTTIQINIAATNNLNFPLKFIICPSGELVVDSGTGANLPANREVKVCVHYLID